MALKPWQKELDWSLAKLIVVKKVPAKSCANCGEAYVDEQIAEELFKAADETARSGAEIVRYYLKAAKRYRYRTPDAGPLT